MKFILIQPIKYINDKRFYCTNTLLALAHLLKTNKQYLLECQDFDGDIILDNSMYELRAPYTLSQLIDLGTLINANIITLPDTKFLNKEQYYTMHKEMAEKVKALGFKNMAVVTCSNNFKTELEEFKILNSIKEIDVIAIPANFSPSELMYKRPEFLDLIEKEIGVENLKKQYHLFGCNSFANLKRERRVWVNSIDGTLPFKEGYYKQSLPMPTWKDHRRPKNYFEISELDNKQVHMIKYNIKVIKEECEKNEDDNI